MAKMQRGVDGMAQEELQQNDDENLELAGSEGNERSARFEEPLVHSDCPYGDEYKKTASSQTSPGRAQEGELSRDLDGFKGENEAAPESIGQPRDDFSQLQNQGSRFEDSVDERGDSPSTVPAQADAGDQFSREQATNESYFGEGQEGRAHDHDQREAPSSQVGYGGSDAGSDFNPPRSQPGNTYRGTGVREDNMDDSGDDVLDSARVHPTESMEYQQYHQAEPLPEFKEPPYSQQYTQQPNQDNRDDTYVQSRGDDAASGNTSEPPAVEHSHEKEGFMAKLIHKLPGHKHSEANATENPDHGLDDSTEHEEKKPSFVTKMMGSCIPVHHKDENEQVFQ